MNGELLPLKDVPYRPVIGTKINLYNEEFVYTELPTPNYLHRLWVSCDYGYAYTRSELLKKYGEVTEHFRLEVPC